MSGLLIFGRSGQLARELAGLAAERGIGWRAVGRETLDLGAEVHGLDGPLAALIAEHGPDLVVNAAGYTAVDRAEDEPEAAYRLNRDAPAALARACAASAMPLVHISTDYVFDGRGGAPYRPSDPVSPLGVYGRSKAEGEAAVASEGGRAVVLRTSWVHSACGQNFVRTMLRLAVEQNEVAVVADQRGRPTWARSLAEAALLAGERLRSGALVETPVLHVTDEGEASWADFAEAVFEGSCRRGGPAARVRRITTAERPTRAARPVDSRLDLTLARQRLGWTPRPWREALELCLDQLFAADPVLAAGRTQAT